MFAEVLQGAAQRAFTEQNEMGKTLAFHRAHPALRKGIQIRAARRKPQALHTSGYQGLAKLSAELGITVVQHVASFTRPKPSTPPVRTSGVAARNAKPWSGPEIPAAPPVEFMKPNPMKQTS